MQATSVLFAHPRDYLMCSIVGFVVLVHAGLRRVAPAFFRKQADDRSTEIKNVFYPALATVMFVWGLWHLVTLQK